MSAPHDTGPSVIEHLATYVSGESFSALPDAAVRAARQAILDTLGVTLAGSREVTAERVRTLITRDFDAPRNLVYKAYTTPELIKRWWGGDRGEVTIYLWKVETLQTAKQ